MKAKFTGASTDTEDVGYSTRFFYNSKVALKQVDVLLVKNNKKVT